MQRMQQRSGKSFRPQTWRRQSYLHVSFFFTMASLWKLVRRCCRCQTFNISLSVTFAETNWFQRFTLRKKCSYSQLFWSTFSRMFSVISPNAKKYGPEKFWIRTIVTQCYRHYIIPLKQTKMLWKYYLNDFVGTPMAIINDYSHDLMLGVKEY